MRPPFVNVTGSWPKGTVPTGPKLHKLDQHSSELVNGDEGGTWTPRTPIVIGFKPRVGDTNARLYVAADSLISGDIETVKGNRRQPRQVGASVGIEAYEPGTPAAPVFETPRSRTIDVAFTCWTESTEIAGNGDPHASEALFAFDPVLMCPRSVMGTVDKRSDNVGVFPLPLRGNHHGARIASVTFYFQIGSRPTALPAQKPHFRIVRYEAADGSAVKMHSFGGAYDSVGWLVDPSANVSTYFDDGNVRSLTYVPDLNNENLDTSGYGYALQWLDDDNDIPEGEQGNAFLGARIVIDQIVSLRSE